MQYLMVYSSSPTYPHDEHWQLNGARLKVSHWYGFGIIDGATLVNRARNWITVPQRNKCTFNMTSQLRESQVGTSDSPLTIIIHVTKNCNIVYLEHVQAITSLRIEDGMRRDISIYLTSPAGTKSLLLPFRPHDRHKDGFHLWPFMTVHTWGEQPQGNWIFNVNVNHASTVKLEALELILFGTSSVPVSVLAIPSSCHSQCLKGCAREGVQYCDVCKHYQLPHTLECVEDCPTGMYVNKNMCRYCHPLCSECNANLCTRCQSHAFQLPNGTCSEGCTESTFMLLNSCVQCHQSCLSCNGPSDANCTRCHPQFILHNHACIIRESTSCPVGEYFDHRAHECRQCHASCASCTGKESIQCSSCHEGDLLNSKGRCVDSRHLRSCYPGQYFDGSNFQCAQCPLSCTNCSDNLTCTSCPQDCYLTQYGTCVESCPPNSVTDNRLFLCLDVHCHHSCSTCFGPDSNHCNSCPVGSLILNNSCVGSCPSHFYASNLTCKTCHHDCDSCVGPLENQCLTCPPGKFLGDKKCVNDCPVGSYGEASKCSLCMKNCSSCISQDSCTRCNEGHYLLEVHTVTNCVADCPSGYVQQSSSRSCQSCPSNCAICYEPSSCHSCQPGYVYYAPGASCQLACPDGYYSSPTENCVSCQLPCSTCTGSALNCSSCSTGMALDTISQKCSECCNPDLAMVQCCDCDWDGRICHWSNLSHVTSRPPIMSTSSSHHIITVVSVAIAISLIVVIIFSILLFLACRYCFRFNKHYQKVPNLDGLDIASDSGSDSDVYTTDPVMS